MEDFLAEVMATACLTVNRTGGFNMTKITYVSRRELNAWLLEHVPKLLKQANGRCKERVVPLEKVLPMIRDAKRKSKTVVLDGGSVGSSYKYAAETTRVEIAWCFIPIKGYSARIVIDRVRCNGSVSHTMSHHQRDWENVFDERSAAARRIREIRSSRRQKKYQVSPRNIDNYLVGTHSLLRNTGTMMIVRFDDIDIPGYVTFKKSEIAEILMELEYTPACKVVDRWYSVVKQDGRYETVRLGIKQLLAKQIMLGDL